MIEGLLNRCMKKQVRKNKGKGKWKYVCILAQIELHADYFCVGFQHGEVVSNDSVYCGL